MQPSQAELWTAIVTVINRYGLTQLSVTKIAETLTINPAFQSKEQDYLERWFTFSLDSMIQGFKTILKTNSIRETI